MPQRIGLALGGGSARGYAHIGILKVLEREHIPINLIAGTSMGSLMGAYYASGISPSELETIALTTKRHHIVKISFSKKSLLSMGKIAKILDRNIGDLTFNELKIPLSVVALDILAEEEYVIDKGSVKEAVMASISVPGVFPPCNMSFLIK